MLWVIAGSKSSLLCFKNSEGILSQPTALSGFNLSIASLTSFLYVCNNTNKLNNNGITIGLERCGWWYIKFLASDPLTPKKWVLILFSEYWGHLKILSNFVRVSYIFIDVVRTGDLYVHQK